MPRIVLLLVENFWLFRSLLSLVLGFYLDQKGYQFPSSCPLQVPTAWANFLCCLVGTQRFNYDMAFIFFLHYIFLGCLPFAAVLNWILLTVLIFNAIPLLFYSIVAYLFNPQGLAPPRLNQLGYWTIALSLISCVSVLIWRCDYHKDGQDGVLKGYIGIVVMICSVQFLLSYVLNLLEHRLFPGLVAAAELI